jgi:hypothetical protein
MIDGLVSDGVWASFDALWVHSAPIAATQAINLISASYPLVQHGAVAFAANVGITGDGSTGFFDTGFTPGSATKYSQKSASLGSYVLSKRTVMAGYCEIGADDNTSPADIAPMIAGVNSVVEINGVSLNYKSSSTNCSGMWIAMLSGGVLSVYRNGSTTPDTTSTIVTKGVPTQSFYIGARHAVGGEMDLPSADQLAVSFIGALTGTQAAAAAARINAFLKGFHDL